MIWDRSTKVEARREASYKASCDREQWHLWFAWHPVEVPMVSGYWIWLQPVERRWYSTREHWVEGAGLFGGRGSTGHAGWEYRK